MGKEHILIGAAGIIIGIAIFAKTKAIVPSLIPLIIGIVIIAFSKK